MIHDIATALVKECQLTPPEKYIVVRRLCTSQIPAVWLTDYDGFAPFFDMGNPYGKTL